MYPGIWVKWMSVKTKLRREFVKQFLSVTLSELPTLNDHFLKF